jgi:phosphohistidine phosphatase
MKTLHLLRHAKSSWDTPGLADRERELNRRGQRDAPAMGAALAQRLAPMAVMVSPARRAQLTLAGLCDGWPALADMTHTTVDALYTFAAQDLFAWLRDREDGLPALFVIGHNPALTDLANALSADDGIANLPTAGYLELGLQIDHWRDLRQGCGRIEYSLFPRQL